MPALHIGPAGSSSGRPARLPRLTTLSRTIAPSVPRGTMPSPAIRSIRFPSITTPVEASGQGWSAAGRSGSVVPVIEIPLRETELIRLSRIERSTNRAGGGPVALTWIPALPSGFLVRSPSTSWISSPETVRLVTGPLRATIRTPLRTWSPSPKGPAEPGFDRSSPVRVRFDASSIRTASWLVPTTRGLSPSP